MTLIAANKDGLYADTRAFHGVSGHSVPSRIEKIRVDSTNRCAMGLTGDICDDERMYELVMHIAYSMSFYQHFCSIWMPKHTDGGPALNLYEDSKAALEGIALDLFSTSGTAGALVITPHHNIEIDEGKIELEKPDAFLAAGSGALSATVLQRSGLTMRQIYAGVHAVDDRVDGLDVTTIARKDLVILLPSSCLRYYVVTGNPKRLEDTTQKGLASIVAMDFATAAMNVVDSANNRLKIGYRVASEILPQLLKKSKEELVESILKEDKTIADTAKEA